MTASISKTIKAIVDSKSAKIDISTLDGQTIRLNCVYKESYSPHFFLVFPEKNLPDTIDKEHHCPVSINTGNAVLTLTAKIIERKGDRTLELTAKTIVEPESLRDYFRVNTKISITAKHTPKSSQDNTTSWTLQGKTLDISGSGLLAIFPKDPPTMHHITLLLSLGPNTAKTICDTHVVRSKRLYKGCYQVSFHFDSISSQDKDSIISFCLQEQRNILREKIQTAE